MRRGLVLTNPWKGKSLRGFTILELVVVLAIMFVVTAVAAPYMNSAIADYRLKSAASDFANLIQRCRTESVKANQSLIIRYGTTSGRPMAYIDLPGGTANVRDANEPMYVFPNSIALQTTGFPGNATTGLNPVAATWNSTPAQFNARGLPCVMVSGVCRNLNAANTPQGFVYYIQGTRAFGPAGWAAVTVTPAGRVHAYLYKGSTYQ